MSDAINTKLENKVEVVESKNTAVMNQLPSEHINARADSPLAHVNLLDNKKSINKNIFLSEEKFLGHLVLRGNASDKSFNVAVQKTLFCDLPTTLQCIYKDDLSIRWISPDEWLIVCAGNKAYELEATLRKALDSHTVQSHYSLCNVSGGQTLLVLSGEHARDVLMKSISYDVADCQFPVGKVVTTAFSKSQAVICRRDENVWELIVRRSFSDYIWRWLQDACLEFNV